jgi:transposase
VQHRANEASKRLQTIHGIGVIGASAISATVTDPKAFRSGRDFARLDRAGTATRFKCGQTEAWTDLKAR